MIEVGQKRVLGQLHDYTADERLYWTYTITEEDPEYSEWYIEYSNGDYSNLTSDTIESHELVSDQE